MASIPQASCTSDPNFAVICSFLERFAKSCGITYPTFRDLQEMLENVEQVPQELIDLHIKLLRKARKTVFLEKWEKALVKFCYTYSILDGQEIEQFGYKKSKLEVKLRALKMLLEGQFDLNSKFKSTINAIESGDLRSKPLGRDRLGRIYWLQFDSTSNIRVYREDLDEESWDLIAHDRLSLVELLKELSGDDFSLDCLNESNNQEDDKSFLDTGQCNDGTNVNDNNSFPNPVDFLEAQSKEISNSGQEVLNSDAHSTNFTNGNNSVEIPAVKCEKNELNSFSAQLNNEHKFSSENDVSDLSENNKTCENDVGEAIEEPVMYIVGDGCGEDCLTGNSNEEDQCKEDNQVLNSDNIVKNQQSKTPSESLSDKNSVTHVTSSEKLKSPILWSIETICGVKNVEKISESNNASDKSENLGQKLKKKNYSSFSIDSVLEKKNENSSSNPTTSSFMTDASFDATLEVDRNEKKVEFFIDPVRESDHILSTTGKDSVLNYAHSKVSLSADSSVTEHTGVTFQKLDLSSEKQDLPSCESLSEKSMSTPNDKIEEVQEVVNTNSKSNHVLSECEMNVSSMIKLEVIPTNASDIKVEKRKDYSCNSESEISDNFEKKEIESLNKVDNLSLSEGTGQPNNAESPSNKYSPVSAICKNSNGSFTEEADIDDQNCTINDNVPNESVKEVKFTPNIIEEEKKEYKDPENEPAKEVSDVNPSFQNQENISVLSDSDKNLSPPVVSENDLNFSKENDASHTILSTIIDDSCNIESSQNHSSSIIKEIVNNELMPKTVLNEIKDNIQSDLNNVKIEKADSNEHIDLSSTDVVNESTNSFCEEKLLLEVKSESLENENKTEEDLVAKDLLATETEFSKLTDLTSEAKENSKNAPEKSKLKKKLCSKRVISRNRKVKNKQHEKIQLKKIAVKSNKQRMIKKKKVLQKNKISGAVESKNEHFGISTPKEEKELENNKILEAKENETLIQNVNEDKESEKEILFTPSSETKNELQKESKTHKGRKFSKRRRRRKNKRLTEGKKEEEEKTPGEKTAPVDNSDTNFNKKKGRPKKDETSIRPGSRRIPAREIKLLGITNTDVELPSIRQSRRIAQIKMKEEAERRREEALQLKSFKSKKNVSKGSKKKSNKFADYESNDDFDKNEPEDSDDQKIKASKSRGTKGKKKKDKLVFDELNPWLSSSGSSTDPDEEEEDIDEEQHEEDDLVFKSDHEFSPESDIEDPDYKPVKRARTAKIEDSKNEAGKYDDTSCENCGENDHPEWILLCDKCDKGWHASCVRPALMIVPEGDWFCPPCEHSILISKLHESLVQYDRCQKQRENEELRKKRLAFVGISLDNVLPPKAIVKSEGELEEGDESKSHSASTSSTKSESLDSDSDLEDEPVYKLRERRSNVTSYRYNEYDELIKSALKDEIEAVKGSSSVNRGKDINNIIKAETQKEFKEDSGSENEELINTGKDVIGDEKNNENQERKEFLDENNEGKSEMLVDEGTVHTGRPTASKSKSKTKKFKNSKIMSLDFTSEEEDHNSDSDFKGVSSEEDSEYSMSVDSDFSDDRKGKRRDDGPLRRSTRARISRYDRDFINDDSEDSPKRKKIRREWDSSESTESDDSWGRKKRKKNTYFNKNKLNKSNQKKKKKTIQDSDSENKKSNKKARNKKVKYAELDSLDEEIVISRRTRGKKINYQETTGSDSEDDRKSHKIRSSRVIESDDDFVAEIEKTEESPGVDSEEIDSESDDGDVEMKDSNEECLESRKKDELEKKNIFEIIKNKNWNIPDIKKVDQNFITVEEWNRLMNDFVNLNEKEEEILKNFLESGEIPIHEMGVALIRAKEKKQFNSTPETIYKEESYESSKMALSSYCSSAERLENLTGGGKFQKIGKMKITPSRAELASHLPSVLPSTTKVSTENESDLLSNVIKVHPPEKVLINVGPLKECAASDLIIKPFHEDPKNPVVEDLAIPLNQSFVNNNSVVHSPLQPTPNLTNSPTSTSVSIMTTTDSQNTPTPTTRECTNYDVMPPQINSKHLICDLTSFPEVISPNKTSNYSNVPGVLPNFDIPDHLKRKRESKPEIKIPRKFEISQPIENVSHEQSDARQLQQPDSKFNQTKDLENFLPNRKGKGRGKKQSTIEVPIQMPKNSISLTRRIPEEFPSQRTHANVGSVITKLLNSSTQSNPIYSASESNSFSMRNSSFSSSLPSQFNSQSMSGLRLRSPAAGGLIFHTSHPHDPSPSGGGAINVSRTDIEAKPSTSSNFVKTSVLPIISSKFLSDCVSKQTFLNETSPSSLELTYTNYYGNFCPTNASSEGSNFQSSTFRDPFGEDQIPGETTIKQSEEETSGEFGGLASYFASQREDDLDT